ncbi:MAG: lactonase family protein [Sphingomonas sp.]|uniref:hypothetical protein n=1 Tax=Sphingomonas sp. TaxID=28214 RepID=UPI0025D7F5CE|nr:hypothetical protein [Sphingomonas sp.]MBY0284580.1 lactonase family protein [Sphingomonas sp.]
MRFDLGLTALVLLTGGAAHARDATVPAPTAAPVERPTSAPTKVVGHLYMQSNTVANAIVHFARRADGTLAEVERVATGGAGSGVFKPVSGQASAPNAFEGAGSVILTSGNTLLFATNGGDNSVSSFRVAAGGRLTLLDHKSTGEAVTGKSGTAKSLAYSPANHTLFVLHAFGPNHIRAFSESAGKLTLRTTGYSVNTATKTDRIPTQLVLSPDQKFLLVDILFDFRPAANADGSAKLVVANAPDKDGLVVFPIDSRGTLRQPIFNDAGGAGPFFIGFLKGRPGTFLNGYAVSDGVAISHIDAKGRVTSTAPVQINTAAGKPSELCWLAITADGKRVYATNFGYGSVTSFALDGDTLRILKDPANDPIPGDGTFRAVNGVVSSGPSDSWLSPDDAFLYQIFGNASTMVGYRVGKDGSLAEVSRNPIAYNSPQGLAGF